MASDQLLLVAALLGTGATYLGKVIQQSHYPKWLNALLLNLTVVFGAGIATFESSGIGTPKALELALLGAFSAAAANHTLVLNSTALGDILKDRVLKIKPPAN